MRIAFFTSSRADFGILRNTVLKLSHDDDTTVQLYVSGSHLSEKYGKTADEVYKTGISNIFSVNSLMDNNENSAISSGCGVGIIELSKLIDFNRPDIFVLLGDRYELLVPATVCVINRIPIIHIHGGEVTEGALDEQIRHAITKMSHIHLVSTEKYAFNISKMGEEDWRINIVGALGLENIKKINELSYDEIEKRTGINLAKKTFLCTYHPVTLEKEYSPADQMNNLFSALDVFGDYQVVFTSPGADPGSEIIIDMINDYVSKKENLYFFKSLGSELYINFAKKSEIVIGNSSSGIIEVPSLKTPTVNIGNRQKGRERAKSVIDCDYSKESIIKALEMALSKEFRKTDDKFMNPYDPYDDDRFSDRVYKIIKNIGKSESILKKKLDFDLLETQWNYFIK